MALKLTATGRPVGLKAAVVASVATAPAQVDPARRKDTALVVQSGAARNLSSVDTEGFAAVLAADALTGDEISRIGAPVVHDFRDLSHLNDGYIVAVSDRTGFTRTIYRP